MPVSQNVTDAAGKPVIIPERLELLERFLQEHFKKDNRQGAVVKIQLRGKPVFDGAYGKSTLEYGLKQDTIFPMASVTKPVIAALLLILQEDGLVEVSEPVCRYLPEFTGGGKEEIRLWHLLTHTSGIKEEEIDKDFDRYITDELGLSLPGQDAKPEQRKEFHLRLCAAMKLDPAKSDRLNDPFYQYMLTQDMKYHVRSHMTYCNLGYRMLKDIVTEVTGESIDSYARRVLFDPVGMKNTFWRLPKEKWSQMAGRSKRAKGHHWYHTEDYFNDESGSGGLKSTSEDMTLFLQMLLDKGAANGRRILSPISVKQMLTNHNEGVPCDLDKKWSSWGYGWNIRQSKHDDGGVLRSSSAFDHGGWGGIKILGDPEYGITIAIMSIGYEVPSPLSEEPLYAPLLNILYSALL